MIEAEHTVSIDASIDQVWDYVKDIQAWALLFPGCRECEVIDDNHSRWIIKVGAGGLVKTVKVLVNVEQWNGPESVIFSYKLESEPVIGRGFYRACKTTERSSEIKLYVEVEGGGQMASMWEAMSKPLLPKMASIFSNRLKEQVESRGGVIVEDPPSWVNRFGSLFKSLFQSLFRKTRS